MYKDKKLFLLAIVVGMTLGAKSKPHLSDWSPPPVRRRAVQAYRLYAGTPVVPPRPEFVVNFCDKTRQLLPPTVGENHLAEVTQKFWVVTEGLAYELARIFLDFGSQTDFPKRFLAQE